MSEVWTPIVRTLETWTAVGPTTPVTPDPTPDPDVPVPVNVITPQITGVFDINRTLTCSTGQWTDATVFAFQWEFNGAPITNERASTYAVRLADRLGVISCTVTATGPGGSASKTSAIISPAVRYTALPVVI